MTQNQKVLRHLREQGGITPVIAMSEYGIMRLASRIADLRRMGYDIHGELVEGVNRYGEKTHYSMYFLWES